MSRSFLKYDDNYYILGMMQLVRLWGNVFSVELHPSLFDSVCTRELYRIELDKSNRRLDLIQTYLFFVYNRLSIIPFIDRSVE